MKLFYFLLQSSWQTVIVALLAGFFSGASTAGLIALISLTISRSPGAAIAPFLLGFAGLALVAALTSFVSQRVLIQLSQTAVFQLRMRLSQQILRAELHHLEQLGSPRLLAALTDDVQSISNAVQNLPFLCIDLAIVLGCMSYLLWLYWSAFLGVIGLLIIGLGSCQFLLTRGWRWMVRVRQEQDRLFQHFRSLTEGTKELKLHYDRRRDFITSELQATADAFRWATVRSLTLFAITSSWGQFLLFFSIGLVLFALPDLLKVTPQALAGYILTFVYLMSPMDRLINNLPKISQASVALRNIELLGLTLNQRAESEAPPPAALRSWQTLHLNGITHTYRGEQEDSHFGLGPIDLTFHPKQLVFIVGGNGSGKSTLAKLITGLYTPESGEIYLDQQLITAENREWYRQHFSVIFADFYLFDRLLGLDAAALERQAQTYLKQLQLDHKVQIEQGSLSTTALSQGQRKRLALLTAYLEDRPIYLFDEWAADQDPAFKELFYTQLLPELRDRGKTILVISHDDQYFHLADRIVKLNYGQVEYEKQWNG